MLCPESWCYRHLISRSRCVPEEFIAKPILGPSILSECVGERGWLDDSAIAGTLSSRWSSEEVPHSLAPMHFSKRNSSGSHCAPFRHFCSIASEVYFYLPSLAFTKGSGFFHNERNWRNKKSSEFEELIWIVSAQGNQVPCGYHRTFFLFKLTPCSALPFITKCFSLLCVL